MIELIRPDWPAPENVKAFSTTRKGGVSVAPYDSFNLADHVDDDEEAVLINRKRLIEAGRLPAQPAWLQQVHSDKVVSPGDSCLQADASITRQQDEVCAVLTADCLPLLMCDQSGSQVAAVHAGWKGLHAGVISNTVKAFNCSSDEVLVWLGPAIGPQSFEVGAEVVSAFTQKNSLNEAAFTQRDSAHWLCDIYQLARIELRQLSVSGIYGGDYDTFKDDEHFFSYRRATHEFVAADGGSGNQADIKTGRMVSLVWLSRT